MKEFQRRRAEEMFPILVGRVKNKMKELRALEARINHFESARTSSDELRTLNFEFLRLKGELVSLDGSMSQMLRYDADMFSNLNSILQSMILELEKLQLRILCLRSAGPI